MLIDTHAHLYWDSYKQSLRSDDLKADFEKMIQRAIDAGVSTIINVGVDIETSKEALRQARGKLAGIPGLSVYSTIGIHPHEAIKYAADPTSIQNDINILEQVYLSDTTKVVAIGECGLDYFSKELDPSVATLPQDDRTIIKNLQRKLFQAQIDLAKKLNLPLVVHCRDDRSKNPENSEAWDEILGIVGNYPTILHCYSGLTQTTNYVLQTTNLTVSFAANITYPKNEYLREAARILPLDRIILETDSPFLSPQSKRGQRNEPSSVKEIAQLIADLKGISIEEIAEQTTENAKKIFKIK